MNPHNTTVLDGNQQYEGAGPASHPFPERININDAYEGKLDINAAMATIAKAILPPQYKASSLTTVVVPYGEASNAFSLSFLVSDKTNDRNISKSVKQQMLTVLHERMDTPTAHALHLDLQKGELLGFTQKQLVDAIVQIAQSYDAKNKLIPGGPQNEAGKTSLETEIARTAQPIPQRFV